MVRGGRYVEGFSEAERAEMMALSPHPPVSLDEFREPTDRKVGTLWVSDTPVSEAHALRAGVDARSGNGDDLAAMLTRSEALAVADSLGARLLTETEWEFVHRAGRQSLFCVADLLRDDATTSSYMSWDCRRSDRPTNGFGLSVLYTPEWTSDVWSNGGGEAVCRSGGAYFWPWQDEEWVWCMSAMRYPEGALPDGRAAARLVLRKPPAAK